MPVEFTVVKRQSLAMFSIRDNRLTYQKDIPLPSGASFAKRSGSTLCIADRENYCVVDLEKAVSIPLIPISQAMDPTPIPIAPHILVCPHNEYLVLSWTGTGTIGVFITDDGMPTRGTLQFDSHPDSICMSNNPWRPTQILTLLQVLIGLMLSHCYQTTRLKCTAQRRKPLFSVCQHPRRSARGDWVCCMRLQVDIWFHRLRARQSWRKHR